MRGVLFTTLDVAAIWDSKSRQISQLDLAVYSYIFYFVNITGFCHLSQIQTMTKVWNLNLYFLCTCCKNHRAGIKLTFGKVCFKTA